VSADGVVEFSPEDLTSALHELTGWALARGVRLEDLRIIRPSLEDVYLQLTDQPAAVPVPRHAPEGVRP
jgi:ABC-2 type transport system ATP-binding protein